MHRSLRPWVPGVLLLAALASVVLSPSRSKAARHPTPGSSSPCGDTLTSDALSAREYVVATLAESDEVLDSLKQSWSLTQADSLDVGFVGDSATCRAARDLYWRVGRAPSPPGDSDAVYVLAVRHRRFVVPVSLDTTPHFGHRTYVVADSTLTRVIGRM